MFEYAIILAAGRGERMKPLTDYIPKPLVYKKDLMLLTRALISVSKVQEIYLTVHYKADKIMASYANDSIDGYIKTYGNDNAWFLHNSLTKEINKPVVIIPADIDFEIDFDALYSEYMSRDLKHLLVPVFPEAMPKYLCEGDIIYGKDGVILDITRDKSENEEIGLCSGIQIINPRFFPRKDSFIEGWRELIQSKNIHYSFTTPKKWACVDRMDQL